MMKCFSCTLPGLLTIILLSNNAVNGYYIQPDILFLTEHPESQYVVVNSSLTLNCGVQLRGLNLTEGGLDVPIVWWTFNNTRISNVFTDAVESTDLSDRHFLHSTLSISHMSHSHTGTYHCNIEDGTNKGDRTRLLGLCYHNPCLPFITASNPAVITVLENSIYEGVVEAEPCSSTLLNCGSLLTGYGLRPVLEWNWNGISLNKHSAADGYGVLANGDLVLYHSIEGEFNCNARSDSNTVTIATYSVTEIDPGGEDSSIESLWLVVSPSLPVENDEFSIYLASSGVCSDIDSLSCMWTRNGSHLCSTDGSGSISDFHLSRYTCYDRAMSVNSPSHLVDKGRYCCELDNGESTNDLCIDIQIAAQILPLISSPHNGTTFTNTTLTPSQLTLYCTPSQPYTSHFWVFNGLMVQDWDKLTEVYVNTSSFGVYQCFAGNQFGYSVITLRLLIADLTNPPGILSFEEIPRPDTMHRPAYIISWKPPNYPDQLNTSLNYSLSTQPPTTTSVPHTELVVKYDSIAYLYTYVFDGGHRLSEISPDLPSIIIQFNNSRCYKLVYFPPMLSTECDSGLLNVSWINNHDNVLYYTSSFYSKHGPNPGRYYINITCYLHDNSMFETGGVFTDEGEAVFDDGLPLGTKCVFRGAATPVTGLAICRNPATILYSVNISCLSTALVEFKDGSLEVNEGEQFKEICLNTRGYNFSVKLVATYDDNTTSVFDVHVSESGVDVCVSVDLKDDKVVDKFMQRNISLSLQTNDSTRIYTGPSIFLTVDDDDVVRVGFTEVNYVIQAGRIRQVCVMAVGELDKKVSVNLTVLELTPDTGVDVLDLDHETLTFLENDRVCVILNASSLVSKNISLALKLSSNDDVVEFYNDTAFVTVIPTPEISTNTLPSTHISIVMVSILLPLLTVTIVIVVCVTLIRCHFNKNNSIIDIKFHEKSMECNEYKGMPRAIFFGSVATIYEGLVLPSVESGLEEKDSGIVSAVNQMNLLPEAVREEGEREEVEVKETEGGEGERDSKPESRVIELSFTDDNTQSPYSSVVSTSSHHEYITTDSMMLFSYPHPTTTTNNTSIAAENSDCSPRLTATQSTAKTNSNTVIVDSTTQQINDNVLQESGITSKNFTTGSESVAGDLNKESTVNYTENTAASVLGDDVSSFITPPLDSGIGMDFNGET